MDNYHHCVYWEPLCVSRALTSEPLLWISLVPWNRFNAYTVYPRTCASSIYTPTYSQMIDEFHTSNLVSTIGLSAFVMGIALGPLLTSPLSEHYGRRPIYLVSWALFMLWNVISAIARNIETMVISRLLAGCAGGTFLSVAGGTVGDVFSRNELQAPMSLVSLAPFIGPALGPLLGGYINYYTYWRWTFYVIIIWSAVLMAAIICFAPETYHPILLLVKARNLRKRTGDDRYRAPTEKTAKEVKTSLTLSLLRPFQLLFLEPMCLSLDLYSAILLGILYLFFGTFPLVFRTNYDMNISQIGLTFLGIMFGLLLAAISNPIWSNIRGRLVKRREAMTGEVGVSEPEDRLPPAILGGILIPIGLFWFGWTSYPEIHWIVPILGSGVFGCGYVFD